ncbi:DUF443 family protein [Staphylococcus aureus]|uniref:DUF443 family protein n=1 Tax=Staphylococcus aureus TaxID=1280 RepID=UPI002ADE13A4|nr:DUF443 family protein [Staphylococcus aureus]
MFIRFPINYFLFFSCLLDREQFTTLKNAVLILYGYLLIGGMSILALSMLLTLENQNLITFIAWGMGLMLFFLMNITLIVNKTVKVIKR